MYKGKNRKWFESECDTHARLINEGGKVFFFNVSPAVSHIVLVPAG